MREGYSVRLKTAEIVSMAGFLSLWTVLRTSLTVMSLPVLGTTSSISPKPCLLLCVHHKEKEAVAFHLPNVSAALLTPTQMCGGGGCGQAASPLPQLSQKAM